MTAQGPGQRFALARRGRVPAPRDRAMLGRSLRVALVVGILLVVITLLMRIGPTYVVVFCVATDGALANARGRAGAGDGGGDAS